jgi:hypothetical protein
MKLASIKPFLIVWAYGVKSIYFKKNPLKLGLLSLLSKWVLNNFNIQKSLKKSNFQVHNFVQNIVPKICRSANTTVIKW